MDFKIRLTTLAIVFVKLGIVSSANPQLDVQYIKGTESWFGKTDITGFLVETREDFGGQAFVIDERPANETQRRYKVYRKISTSASDYTVHVAYIRMFKGHTEVEYDPLIWLDTNEADGNLAEVFAQPLFTYKRCNFQSKVSYLAISDYYVNNCSLPTPYQDCCKGVPGEIKLESTARRKRGRREIISNPIVNLLFQNDIDKAIEEGEFPLDPTMYYDDEELFRNQPDYTEHKRFKRMKREVREVEDVMGLGESSSSKKERRNILDLSLLPGYMQADAAKKHKSLPLPSSSDFGISDYDMSETSSESKSSKKKSKTSTSKSSSKSSTSSTSAKKSKSKSEKEESSSSKKKKHQESEDEEGSSKHKKTKSSSSSSDKKKASKSESSSSSSSSSKKSSKSSDSASESKSSSSKKSLSKGEGQDLKESKKSTKTSAASKKDSSSASSSSAKKSSSASSSTASGTSSSAKKGALLPPNPPTDTSSSANETSLVASNTTAGTSETSDSGTNTTTGTSETSDSGTNTTDTGSSVTGETKTESQDTNKPYAPEIPYTPEAGSSNMSTEAWVPDETTEVAYSSPPDYEPEANDETESSASDNNSDTTATGGATNGTETDGQGTGENVESSQSSNTTITNNEENITSNTDADGNEVVDSNSTSITTDIKTNRNNDEPEETETKSVQETKNCKRVITKTITIIDKDGERTETITETSEEEEDEDKPFQDSAESELIFANLLTGPPGYKPVGDFYFRVLDLSPTVNTIFETHELLQKEPKDSPVLKAVASYIVFGDDNGHPLLEDKLTPFTGTFTCPYQRMEISKVIDSLDKEQLVDFHLANLRAQCVKNVREHLLKLFDVGLVKVKTGLRVKLEDTHKYFRQRILNRQEWLDSISAIFLATFSNAFMDANERLGRGARDNRSPDGRTISYSVRTLSLMVLKGMDLLDGFGYHIVKVIRFFSNIAREKFLELLNAKLYLEQTCGRIKCKKELTTNYNDRMVLMGLMEFAIFGVDKAIQEKTRGIEMTFDNFYKSTKEFLKNRVMRFSQSPKPPVVTGA